MEVILSKSLTIVGSTLREYHFDALCLLSGFQKVLSCFNIMVGLWEV